MTLLKTYHRYQQRMLVYNGFRALGETVVGAASLMSGGGAGDTGQEQGATSTNDPTAGGGSSDPEAMFNNVNADSPQSSSPEEMFSQPSYAGYGDQSGYGGPGSDYGGGSPD